MNSNMPFTLWILGPTSAGKTTIANKLMKQLSELNVMALHFDGDEVRELFGPSHGFEKEDRLLVVKALVHFANKSVKAGINVVVSALTANEESRQYVYNNASNLIVCYINCGIEVCINRDPKGLYKKALNGEIDSLPGVNSPYAPPDKYDFIIDSEHYEAYQCAEQILKKLRELNALRK